MARRRSRQRIRPLQGPRRGSVPVKLVYLGGGVGGAKLLQGLAAECPPENLTAIINTGDDFEHWGLWISPDIDTSMYTLAGVIDPVKGWGRAEESWNVFEEMKALGAEDWFLLGDRDMAVHLERTRRLRTGSSLTEVTQHLCQAFGVKVRLLPMTDKPRATWMHLADGRDMPFQDWLVKEGGVPPVAYVEYRGTDAPSPQVLAALDAADAVIVGPSNPWVSILPMTTLRGVAERLKRLPVIAVSPIIAGTAVKGPLVSMIASILQQQATPDAVFSLYAGWLDTGVIDVQDAPDREQPGRIAAPILLPDLAARRHLARRLLDILGA
ncbi:MAG: 2-phospho-L-lactate transferase [Candidatus Dadabacteria bacterium]|nr:MAG: 2-phospho-L-lactate transferase [Candidatus Dadabacteria bacterium]